MGDTNRNFQGRGGRFRGRGNGNNFRGNWNRKRPNGRDDSGISHPLRFQNSLFDFFLKGPAVNSGGGAWASSELCPYRGWFHYLPSEGQ